MNNDRLSLYREAMDLEEGMDTLQAAIQNMTSQLTRIFQQLAGCVEDASDVAESAQSVGVVASRKKQSRPARGGRGPNILTTLMKAGHAGLHVKEIAAQIGAKAPIVYAWIYYHGKKFPQLQQIEPSRYRFEGTLSVPEIQSILTTIVDPAAIAKNRGYFGTWTAKMLKALENADPDGVSISELAEELRVPVARIANWFATTGKKYPSVKRIRRGFYRMDQV